MKKLLLLLPLALLCGCAREPSPVSALALDRAGNGCRLTAELVRQDTPEDAAVPSCLAAQGDSFTDALHALEGLLPGELYLSHAQVLLLVSALGHVFLPVPPAQVRSTAQKLLAALEQQLSALCSRIDTTGQLTDGDCAQILDAAKRFIAQQLNPDGERK